MAEYAYLRCSTKEQNEDRQLEAIRELNIKQERVFIDKQSGKDFKRTAYKKLLSTIKKNDIIYVLSIDRLGRNYTEIQEQWRLLTKEKGVDIVVLDMPLLDTRQYKDLMGTFLSDVVLQLLAFVAQQEYENIRSRQAQGISSARAKGIKFGRPVKMPPENFKKMVKCWERGEVELKVLLDEFQMSESTFYRRLREYRVSKNRQ